MCLRELVVNMSTSTNPVSGSGRRFFTVTDAFFVLFLLVIFAAVTFLGLINYSFAAKTEIAKRQAEALLTWFGDQAGPRGVADYEFKACGPSLSDAKPPLPVWSDCRAAILAQPPFNTMQNSFNGGPLIFAEQCASGEDHLRGALVLAKVVTLPEGSAYPTAISALTDTDQLARKLSIRVSICDRHGRTIFVDETPF